MKIVQTSLSESVTQHLAERILCGELPACCPAKMNWQQFPWLNSAFAK